MIIDEIEVVYYRRTRGGRRQVWKSSSGLVGGQSIPTKYMTIATKIVLDFIWGVLRREPVEQTAKCMAKVVREIVPMTKEEVKKMRNLGG